MTSCDRDRGTVPEAQEAEGQAVPTAAPIIASPSPIVTQNQGTGEPDSQATSVPNRQPTATPIRSTSQKLIEAEALYRYGNYVESRVLYTAFLSEPFSETGQGESDERYIRQQVQYQIAKSYFAEDAYGEALATLDQLVIERADSQALPDDLGPKIDYLRAEALVSLGQYRDAIELYKAFLVTYPWMAEVVYPQIGELYLELDEMAQAEIAYRQAVDATTDRVSRVRLLETLAQIYKHFEQYDRAIAAYEEILDIAEKEPYRAYIHYLVGETLAEANNEAAAIARWLVATEEAPSSDAAYQSLIELVNRGVDFDLFQRGQIDLDAGAWWPTINAFQAYLDSVPPTDSRAAKALHGIGQAYLGLGDYASAIKTFDQLLVDYPECDCMGQVWLDKATAEATSGDREEARRVYRTFARTYPQEPLAAEALWQSGLMAYEDGNELEAAVDFLVLADSAPLSERAPFALYITALGGYQKGFYSQSIELYSRLEKEYPDYRPGAALYWLGRSHQANGNVSSAQAAWARAVESVPGSYYGVLSAYSLHDTAKNGNAGGTVSGQARYGEDLVKHIAAVAGPASTLAGDDGGQVFAEAWLADWLETDGKNFAILPSTVAEDAELNIGRLLLELEERGQALEILERVYQRHREDPHALYALSLEFEALGVYRLSLISMVRLLSLSPAEHLENAPIFLQKRAYPQRFEELIERESIAHDLDPLLFYSLVRQESLFEEGARSYAAAQGLAQIIPDTGEWIAQRVGFPNYTNALVYRPHINVRFGAYYLDWARDYLDGNLVSALVGYNAGPGNSEHWRGISGADDAFFVEILTYNEPRIYVQTITEGIYHYSRLYRQ